MFVEMAERAPMFLPTSDRSGHFRGWRFARLMQLDRSRGTYTDLNAATYFLENFTVESISAIRVSNAAHPS